MKQVRGRSRYVEFFVSKLPLIFMRFVWCICYTEVKVNGQISSSNTAQGRITYKGTYKKEDSKPQLKIESKVFDVKGYEDCTVNFTANHDGLKLEFGDANVQYQINASGQIQDQGKNLRLQTQWTEVKLTQFLWEKKNEIREPREAYSN